MLPGTKTPGAGIGSQDKFYEGARRPLNPCAQNRRFLAKIKGEQRDENLPVIPIFWTIPAGENHKHKGRVLTDKVKAILVEDGVYNE